MPHTFPTWKLISAGICSLVLVMGISRFALTPLLPAMQSTTGMGDDSAGLLAAFNYMGYLSGALIASRLRDPLKKIQLFRWGMVLAVLTTLAIGLADNMILWCGLRLVAGLTSAAGMVVGTSIVMDHLKQRHHPDYYIGIHFSGVGLGVIVSGSVLGWAVTQLVWQEGWLLIGAVGFIFALPALAWMHIDGLTPPPPTHADAVKLYQPHILFLLISYCLAGAAFSIGTTFIISIMANNPALADSSSLAWVLLGVALAPSCYFWMKIATRYGDFNALVAAYIIQAVGCALPVLLPSAATALIGGLMFGFCFMGIVTVVVALGGKLSPHNPSALIGILVVSYGVGQIVGPVIIGFAMEKTGFSELGLWSASVCSLASILFMMGTRRKT